MTTASDATAIATRFAPSPTGALHLGHAFSAIVAHDLARASGGRFILRIDDIDGTRSRAELVAPMLDDLRWLGLSWDGEPVFQSSRLAHYQAGLNQLRAMGLLYRCFCTRSDIAAMATAPHGPMGSLYPGTCRALSDSDSDARADDGAPHAWRLRIDDAVAHVGGPDALHWHDMRHGPQCSDPRSHGDIVLGRKDALASYHLASTLDDAALGMTHIVRGADLMPVTDIHRLLVALFDLPVPVWHHHALVTGPDGQRLAKRADALALHTLRDQGIDGPALADALRAGQMPVGTGLQDA